MSEFSIQNKMPGASLSATKSLTTDAISEFRSKSLKDLMPKGPGEQGGSGSTSFIDVLKESIKETNEAQKTADKMAVEVASGKSENLHETMLAMTQSELAFDLMVQVRNRALEAYNEVMRMPV